MFNKKFTDISAEEANALIIKSKELIVLDVRTKEEYDEGHIIEAKLLPVQNISSRISELLEYMDKPILVYCSSGIRSQRAINFLAMNDFKKLYQLSEGITSWKFNLVK